MAEQQNAYGQQAYGPQAGGFYGTQAQLTDRDIVTDLLKDMKFLSDQAHLAVQEATSREIWNTFQRLMIDHLQAQRSIWEAMHSRGWYNPQ